MDAGAGCIDAFFDRERTQFTGNKEVHEIPLGGTLYQDVFSGQIRDRADEEDEDDDL